jgi:hypothetical protein
MERRQKNPIPVEIQRRITKIFVSNLPEGCSGADLASHIRLHGQIYDIYIARKRDKGGNRFGFISMLDVKDRDDLLKNLRGIRMGDYKLWFNIARFVLEDGEINTAIPMQPMKNKTDPNMVDRETSAPTFGPSVTGAWSFKERLVGKSINIDSNINAFSSLHGRAVVSKMVDVMALKKIYVFLNEICPGYGNVQYLGGLDLLISFDEMEAAQKFRSMAESMKESFSTVRPWEGQSLGFERLAWLKVQGLPLHLISNEVINAVGGMFGKVVHKASKEESDPDLSFEYVGVLVGDGKRISDEVTLNWRNRKFRIWVAEEAGDWIPDFTDVPTDQGDDSVDSESLMEEDAMEHHLVGSPDNLDDGNGNPPTNVEPITEPVCEPTTEPDLDQEVNDNIQCPNNDFIDIQSSTFKEVNVPEEIADDSFIPGINFDFGIPNEKDHFSPSTSKVVKRKKCKKMDVGRSSLN